MVISGGVRVSTYHYMCLLAQLYRGDVIVSIFRCIRLHDYIVVSQEVSVILLFTLARLYHGSLREGIVRCRLYDLQGYTVVM